MAIDLMNLNPHDREVIAAFRAAQDSEGYLPEQNVPDEVDEATGLLEDIHDGLAHALDAETPPTPQALALRASIQDGLLRLLTALQGMRDEIAEVDADTEPRDRAHT